MLRSTAKESVSIGSDASEKRDTDGRSDIKSFKYSCSKCAKSFQFRCTYLRHLKTHTRERPYLCTTCYKRYKYKSGLRSHRCSGTLKRNSCRVCGLHVENGSSLRDHQCGDRPYKCSRCSAAFDMSWKLKRHLASHGGERPFVCDICAKGFSLNQTLVQHQSGHLTDQMHCKPECPKRFVNIIALKRHILTHTDTRARPYLCEECSKSYKTPGLLKRHSRETHSRKDKCSDFVTRVSSTSNRQGQQLKSSSQMMDTESKTVCPKYTHSIQNLLSVHVPRNQAAKADDFHRTPTKPGPVFFKKVLLARHYMSV